QQISFVPDTRLVAVVGGLGEAIGELKAGSGTQTALLSLQSQLVDQVSAASDGALTVLSTKLSNLIKTNLGLPADAFTLNFSIVNATPDGDTVQPTVVAHLNINKSFTGNFPLALDVPDLGPLTVSAGGLIQVTVDGDLDLDFGLNLYSLTPYVMDTSRVRVEA